MLTSSQANLLIGIGRFTIADETIVGDADLGVNFFLEESSKGKSRARCCTELLQELNPEVVGDWYPKDKGPFNLQQLLETSSTPFTMILYSLPLEAMRINTLQKYSQQHKIPLISVHSIGFYSYFQLKLPGVFPVVDTHPDENSTADLRFLQPWPELVDFAGKMTEKIDSLDNHEHGHLPMVVILLHYLNVWKSQHEGNYPVSYGDKKAFRKMLTDATRTNTPEGGEENFDEAVNAVMKHVVVPSIPSSLQQVFDYQLLTKVSASRYVCPPQSNCFPGSPAVQFLAYSGCLENIPCKTWLSASRRRLTGYESTVGCIHPTPKYLQSQRTGRCLRSLARSAQQARRREC